MRTGPDRSSDHGPKTVRTGLRTGPGPVFPRTDPSLYMTRKVLEFGKYLKRYAVCPSCNKLYKESEIHSTSGFKCNHVKFLNHPRRNLRKPCGIKITDWVPTTSGFIIKPKMLPFTILKSTNNCDVSASRI